jgi:hypothetical protein
MVDVFERLCAALESRYHIERELGRGGMASQAGGRAGGPADRCYG